MPDFDAITVALAARFITPALTAPAGYVTVRVATGDLPGELPPLPTVLVFPEQGTFVHSAGKRDSTHSFLVRFYYNQIGDPTRDMVALRKWLAVLVNQLQGAVQLGGIVTMAHVASYRVGEMSYGGIEYSGVELSVSVNVNEPWAPVA